MERATSAGLLAVIGGALLVVALLLPWWGPPDPATSSGDAGYFLTFFEDGESWDGFEFFDVRDVVWLAAGIAGFGFGLALLTLPRVPLPAVLLAATVGLTATVLVLVTLASPPTLYDVASDAIQDAIGKQPDTFGIDELQFSREIGGFLALTAVAGITAAAAALELIAGRGLHWRRMP